MGKRASPTHWNKETYSQNDKRTKFNDRTPSEYLAFLWPEVKEVYDANKQSNPKQYEENTWKGLVTHKGKSSMMTVTLKGIIDDKRGDLSDSEKHRFIFELNINGEKGKWTWSHKFNWDGGPFPFETYYQLLCFFDLDARTI